MHQAVAPLLLPQEPLEVLAALLPATFHVCTSHPWSQVPGPPGEFLPDSGHIHHLLDQEGGPGQGGTQASVGLFSCHSVHVSAQFHWAVTTDSLAMLGGQLVLATVLCLVTLQDPHYQPVTFTFLHFIIWCPQ